MNKSCRLLPAASPLVLAALLAACGGGGDSSGPAATAGPAALSAPATAGRAQALAFTMPALLPPPAGLTGNVDCANWDVGAVTVDNVEVPPGTRCHLTGTTVRGSVKVHAGAILVARHAQVAGSVQGAEAAHVQFSGVDSRIGGSLQLEGGGSAAVSAVRVAGDLFINGLNDLVSALDNQVGGNLQLMGNLGGADIRGNQIKGNLQCDGNLPAPLVADNTAASLEGQCRGTGAGSPPGPSTPPLSGNVTCVGLTIGAVQLDSVIVPTGASCTLVGTRLKGNLEVGASARLVADGVSITGGVVADGATELVIGGNSTVGGSVQIQRGAGAVVVDSRLGGSLQIDAMAGAVIAGNNHVWGNLQAMANRAALSFIGNQIGGVMQCKDNLPAPVGHDNVASQKQDQCLGL